ncbi:MAG: hypothetical protein JW776_03290 [Candidatus Lokiarchaeota archaeon]|nr:hypothetical protein [Candidatus Lokiarchaeota archaeon]
MIAYLLETPVGMLITDQNGLIQNYFLTTALLDEQLLLVLHYDESVYQIPAFVQFINQINVSKYNLVTETKDMANLLESKYEGTIKIAPFDRKFQDLRINLSKILANINIPSSVEELTIISRKNAKLFSRDRIRESGQSSDVHIINAVGVLENTTKFINSYAIQLREWYGSHFPELTDKLVNDIELYAKIVNLYQKRDTIEALNLVNDLHIKEEYAKEIEYQAEHSMGGDLTESQLDAIRIFSKTILNLIDFQKQLENSVNTILQELTPNLYTLIGAQLTGKLITHAGSLEHLAKIPSSTIQVLGAEKALFRALRKKTDSPKHGIIYTWPPIRSAKYWQRGKISRLLSGKISICAKVDFFNGEFIGKKLLDELEAKIKDIEERFPEPPKHERKKKPKDYSSKKKKEIARKKAYHMSKSKYKSGIKKSESN